MKFQGIFFIYCFFFFFRYKATEKQPDNLLRNLPADDVPPEQSDDLGGVCQSQRETKTLEEVSR